MNIWHLKQCNRNVATFITTQSQRRHLSNIHHIKPSINFSSGKTAPWKPSFSLSKHKNRYHKYTQSEIHRDNQSLVKKICEIETTRKQRANFVQEIPQTVPSNSTNFKNFKKRERMYKNKKISHQNMKMFYRIMSAKNYDHRRMERDWEENQQYRQNISGVSHKTNGVLDYSRLANIRQEKRKKEFEWFQRDKNKASRAVSSLGLQKSSHNIQKEEYQDCNTKNGQKASKYNLRRPKQQDGNVGLNSQLFQSCQTVQNESPNLQLEHNWLQDKNSSNLRNIPISRSENCSQNNSSHKHRPLTTKYQANHRRNLKIQEKNGNKMIQFGQKENKKSQLSSHLLKKNKNHFSIIKTNNK